MQAQTTNDDDDDNDLLFVLPLHLVMILHLLRPRPAHLGSLRYQIH